MMSLNKRQKVILHIYKDLAGLSESEYRSILKAKSGYATSTAKDFTQAAFDHVMAALETVLFDRVDLLERPCPIRTHNKWVRSRFYWRTRCESNARINNRQVFIIKDLWAKLCHFLPEEKRTVYYFAGIVFKATNKNDIGLSSLLKIEAGCVIDALRDRLKYSVRHDSIRRIP